MTMEVPVFGGGGKGAESPLKPVPPAPAHVSKAAQDVDTSGSVKTQADTLEELRLMQTNFVFLYGDTKAGKSAICSSLMYYMMTHPDVGSLTERGLNSDQDFIRRAVGEIRKKRFLPRTQKESVTLAGGKFQPANHNFSPIPITFMEMAGEDLRDLIAPKERISFPTHVDVYLNDKTLNLVFVLVVRHDMASHEKDLMLSDFVDYLCSKDARFKKSRLLLLVSQWDSYSGELGVEEFVKEYLPLTYAALSDAKNSIAAYKVGEVTTVDGEPYISVLDEDSPKRVLRWLYYAVTGNDFMRQSFWRRLVRMMQ